MSYSVRDYYNPESSNFASGDILQDWTKTGKKRDWKGKKSRTELTAEHFQAADLEKKAERMKACADVLTFKKTPDGLKLYQTWFCKVRLCPMCNWRRSLKIAYHNKQIVETVNERYKVRWLFLTLTVRNVEGNDLPETLKVMSQAFSRLKNYKAFKTSVKGFFKALEVTKNRDPKSKSFDTYHPHFHVLLCVPRSYFTKNYIKHSEWTSLWQKAMKLDYEPIVHVQRVKPKKDLVDLQDYEQDVRQAIKEKSALLEISKYPVKDTDVIQGDEVTEENVETVKALDTALAYKRLISYGGLLKDIHKELNLDDAEEDDLVNVTGEDEEANGIFDVIAKWHVGLRDYIILHGG